ncbi:phage holin family protein [Streptomyces exfoliatus]|uniref:phage holin family protein n=1 Tax=Streptomyces exfoliatus TaxID=1905 RepID=UPI000A73FA6F|nr:phage holin family protein [Streptomyces exfoliatus]
MTEQGRRKLGVLVGVGLAGGLLPGITLGTETVEAALSVLAATLVLVVLTQLIHIGPSGRVPLPILAALGLVGFLQDALIWWLLSWLGPKVSELRVEGIGTILLAALITRGTFLLLSQLTSTVEIAKEG